MALRSHVVVVEAAGEVFRAPPSLGRQLEARQRAAGADESRALLATDSCPADPATPRRAVWLCGLKCPGSPATGGRYIPPAFPGSRGHILPMLCTATADWQP